MADQDNILQFLAVNGPSLPSKVAKLIRSEIIIASAHLSDLSAQGKLKISDLKVGGSPLYYLKGQEDQLERFAQSNMNPQDYRILMMLKEKKVLREAEQDLLTKVALRTLKDFAFPLHVTHQGKTELFWKWYLLPEAETNSIIREMLVGKPQEEIAEQAQVSATASVERFISPVNLTPTNPLQRAEGKLVEAPSIKKEEAPLRKEEKIVKRRIVLPKEPLHKEDRLTQKEEPQINWEEEKINEEKPNLEKHEDKNTLKEEQKKLEVAEEKEEGGEKEEREQKITEKKIKIKSIDKPLKKRAAIREDFFPVVEEFFRCKKIIIEQKEIIRKNAEIDFILKVPSVVGHLTYFCKAKNKSKCNEKDLSSAYMEAQIKKLPLLFLYLDELNKKAQEMLDTGAFENAIVKRIE